VRARLRECVSSPCGDDGGVDPVLRACVREEDAGGREAGACVYYAPLMGIWP